MINKIPFLGWFLSFIGHVSLSVPFWICWTICNTGKTYFYFLPEVYQSIPFWNCVGLFMCLTILSSFLKLVIITSKSSSSSTTKE